MTKFHLKSIVRNKGKGHQGIGVEVFRLDTEDEVTLTEEETEIVEEQDDTSSTAIMRIYESIGEDFWTGGGVTAKKFSDELGALGDLKRLNIHINCLGGDCFDAQAIHSIISDFDAKKTSYIDGVCASAATVIACAADEVVARHNTTYMIHNPWALCMGNAGQMRKAAEDLEKITTPIVSVYKNQVKGKIDEDKIKALMEAESWMTADEALDYGFVDKVRGKIRAIARVGKSKIFCSGVLMDAGKYGYKNIPKYKLATEDEIVKINEEENVNEGKENDNMAMTREQFKQQHPDEYQALVTETRTNEQARLIGLDAMMAPGLEAIIKNAKEKGLQPNDISMECFNVTKQQLVSSNTISALKRDGAPIASIPAGDAPNNKPKPTSRGTDLLTKAFANGPSGTRAQRDKNGRN
jgi:ATP-dependent Clp protease protease subunit